MTRLIMINKHKMCLVDAAITLLHFPVTRMDRFVGGPLSTFITAISSLHLFLFSTALWELVNSSPVHSLMLSSYISYIVTLCTGIGLGTSMLDLKAAV